MTFRPAPAPGKLPFVDHDIADFVGTERLMAVPGVLNLRDAGGFPTGDGRTVVTGMLFRSGSLHELTPEGAAQLSALGLRTIVDLRNKVETDFWPNQCHDLTAVTLNMPIFRALEEALADAQDADDAAAAAAADADADTADAEAGAETLTGLYDYLVDTCGPTITAVIRRLAQPEALPALLHCAVGKDRTGVTVGLLLSLLGVADEEILADFHLSNIGLGFHLGPVLYVDENGVERESRPVHPQLLADAFARIRSTHGSAEGFLLAHGATPAELAHLRATLTH